MLGGAVDVERGASSSSVHGGDDSRPAAAAAGAAAGTAERDLVAVAAPKLSTQQPSCAGAHVRVVFFTLVAIVVVPILYVGMRVEERLKGKSQFFLRALWTFWGAALDDLLVVARPWMRSSIGHRRCFWRFPTLEQDIVLTMDDAPGDSPKEMLGLLDLLEENQIRVTFFITTSFVRNAELERTMQRIVDAGHEIGNHMPEDKPYHRLSAEAFRAELRKAEDVLARFDPHRFGPTRTNRRWFRPPHGRLSNAMMNVLVEEDYYIALGDVFSNDAAIGGRIDPPRPSAISFHERFVQRHVKAGSIVVFHVPNKNSRKQTLPILTRLLAHWDDLDVSVQRLCDMSPNLDATGASDPRVGTAPVF
ncbi:Bifunctional xylanase/deacetylase [Hondaea fermentalgiana]|uniref:Bifunctional xylanase/deacetylase n=1 Tax=Hondaea fermentalgiana TaxID=2315210 RepID=A0A2R5GUI6_9STRA|nr:Bifunctional xylanase/deacetylase [Hondaea fermentalgiana]|eukprot:GBG34537.1 Bifunctional xylanase/deacetylase [Hondaea fermentalgiana]